MSGALVGELGSGVSMAEVEGQGEGRSGFDFFEDLLVEGSIRLRKCG